MAHSIILTSHIIAGVLGVLLGPVAIAGLARGRAGSVVSAYHLAVAFVCLSAVGLAALDFAALWWFVLVSAAAYAFAVRGLLAIRSGRLGWVARAVRGFGGAYIALWTAILVVSVPAMPVVWLLPTVLGVPALEWFAARLRGERSGAGAGTFEHLAAGADPVVLAAGASQRHLDVGRVVTEPDDPTLCDQFVPIRGGAVDEEHDLRMRRAAP